MHIIQIDGKEKKNEQECYGYYSNDQNLKFLIAKKFAKVLAIIAADYMA